jgi:hypothetical protein
MRKSFFIAGTLSFLLSVSAWARNPIGEIANYKLDRARNRTSGVVQKGVLSFKGGEFKQKGDKGVYETTFNYDLKILMAGHKKGEKIIDVSSDFFSEDFMARLKQEGVIDEGTFKLKYLGTEDVETIFGVKYKDCHKVFVYDVKSIQLQELESFAEVFEEMYKVEQGEPLPSTANLEVKNIKATLMISTEVPLLGAVKVDVSGNVSGANMKAGFDYQPPSVVDAADKQP